MVLDTTLWAAEAPLAEWKVKSPEDLRKIGSTLHISIVLQLKSLFKAGSFQPVNFLANTGSGHCFGGLGNIVHRMCQDGIIVRDNQTFTRFSN